MSTISNVLAASRTTAQSSTPIQNGAIGKDDFLKLLVTQLQHQDPLKPTDNDAFIMQSAAFSQVEQLTKLVSLVEQLLDKQTTPPSPPAGGTNGTTTA
ncbi:MAG: flgD [Nitrospira sp.]|jgi:flagellar basal-body rod modification protein FlgD|nr:flgD [Nitrospira sp.]